MFEMIHVLMLVVFVILFIGFRFKDYTFSFMGAMMSCIVGIYIATNGVTNINNWLTQSIAAIYLGVGFYILGKGSVELMKKQF